MSNQTEVALTKSKYGIGISWDRDGNGVDVDLQAVVVDTKGTIIDAVYYNNLKALKAITHSGDETTGERAGLDECIWVTLTKLPEHVKMIMFVIAAYSGGALRDAKNGMIHVLEDRKDCEVGRYEMEHSKFNVDAVAIMIKLGGSWCLRIIEVPAQEGRHFIDILEPTLGNLIRKEIPSAPRKMKVAFAMEKGTVVDLPDTATIGQVQAGLGWDVSPRAGDVDLDVSAVFFSKEAKEIGAVFFGNTEEFGLVHSGDNLTGEGAGDDEVITANLDIIPPSVDQIFFVVNIYTNGVTFEAVSNAYCRIFDKTGAEMARYVLGEGRGARGLIIARLFRAPGDRWGFQAIGSFCKGKTWKDAVPDIVPLVHKTAHDLQKNRGMTTMTFGEAPPQQSQPVAAPPAKKSSACAMM